MPLEGEIRFAIDHSRASVNTFRRSLISDSSPPHPIAIAVPGSISYHKQVIFERMLLWMDPVKRPGPEAMAVDEWLLETAELPVLRVYGWRGEWGSVGYFGCLTEARASFPGVDWVRRWTGGGTVDHRNDWTYTLVAPSGGGLAKLRGAESYQVVHEALAACLTEEGLSARLSTGAGETGAAACFQNPVNHDIVGPGGAKLAGAGQRRTKRGLLHQGSVAAACDPEKSHARAQRLAACLTDNWQIADLRPPQDWIDKKVLERYGSIPWITRRSGVLQAP
jgi:lipoate-protein ligase A